MEDYKNYIRVNENGHIIKSFSTAFEEPLETDILYDDRGQRHFNLELFYENGCPKSKYKNGVIIGLSAGEQQTWIDENIDKEKIYKARVKELIKKQYDVDCELHITNDCILAKENGEPVPQKYWDYRAYIEECKDIAHMEVYGIERT